MIVVAFIFILLVIILISTMGTEISDLTAGMIGLSFLLTIGMIYYAIQQGKTLTVNKRYYT